MPTKNSRRAQRAGATMLILAGAGLSHAQTPAAATNSNPSLAPALVTGNPLQSEAVAVPSSTLSGDGLVLRRGSTLGETLDGLPGVSSSWFGPGANRPIIRGQDGDRIRVLTGGGASLDASSLSYDHAVPIDPLVVERVEVLRGPAALLYGGSATGGVVNTIDNRIPRADVAETGGAVEVRLGGSADERGASAVVETGGSGFALHADAFGRRTDDLRVPAFDRPVEDGGTERRTRVVNSASDAKGGALGGSMVWVDGYLGASVDTYRNEYGSVAEDEVSIDMKRDRFALSGEARKLGGFIETARAQASATDYEHREMEGGEVGTTFRNRGGDGRVELVHAKQTLGAGSLQGVFGLQAEQSRFSALGEEAFVPSTRTRSLAAFVLEQWSVGGLQLSGGLRGERVRISSGGDTADADEPRFGDAQTRRFSPVSASAGAVYSLSPEWQLSGNLAYTERAPTFYELFANGVHVATGTFERGDPQQSLERGRNLDVALQWKRGPNSMKVGAFASRFSNYIALAATGEPDAVNDEGESFPVYAFRGVRARLYGIEGEGRWRVWDGASRVDLDARLDLTRGDDLSNDQPLPRLAPLRVTLGADYALGSWAARAEVQHAARQSRVPSDDVATPSWTIVNISASYRLSVGGSDALLFLKLNNLGDELAYNASTIGTVRDLAPLPGRSLMAGMRLTF